MIKEVKMVETETRFTMAFDDYLYLDAYFEELQAYGKKQGLPISGYPFSAYLGWLLFENREEIMTVFKKFIESEGE